MSLPVCPADVLHVVDSGQDGRHAHHLSSIESIETAQLCAMSRPAETRVCGGRVMLLTISQQCITKHVYIPVCASRAVCAAASVRMTGITDSLEKYHILRMQSRSSAVTLPRLLV